MRYQPYAPARARCFPRQQVLQRGSHVLGDADRPAAPTLPRTPWRGPSELESRSDPLSNSGQRAYGVPRSAGTLRVGAICRFAHATHLTSDYSGTGGCFFVDTADERLLGVAAFCAEQLPPVNRGCLSGAFERWRVLPEQRLRIALIEDDVMMRNLLTEILADEGYDVLAYDGADGAHRLRRFSPSVVLLDLELGGAHGASRGWQILDQLVLDPATRDVPVVIFSAERSLDLRRPAISSKHGLWALRKPFDLTELLTIVGQAASNQLDATRS